MSEREKDIEKEFIKFDNVEKVIYTRFLLRNFHIISSLMKIVKSIGILLENFAY